MRPTCAALARGFILAMAVAGAGAAQSSDRFQTDKAEVVVETVAGGLDHPWSLAFLPDGRMLVTERPGRLRIVTADGQLSPPLTGLPLLFSRGQGGLLDVAIDPSFAQNRLIYLSYAEDRGGGQAGTSVARGRLNASGTGLEGLQVIFRQTPAHTGSNHFGSRLVFDRTGALFITTGDRYDLMEGAQNPANSIGKILRLRPDGGQAPDNPFDGQAGMRPEIWSLGHRNVQGATLHPATGDLWAAEHGARGGDEINIVRRGRNYGWPVIAYGVHYSGARIGEGSAKPGFEQPVYHWDPSLAPSGMTFYTGEKFPGWRDSLLVGMLKGRVLSRLEVSGTKITHEERMLQGLGERIRDVRQGPDGFVYLLTDAADGRILRLRPGERRP